MKSLFTRFAPAIVVVALAAGGGVALTTIAHAQTSAAPPAAPPAPHPPMERGGPGMHHGEPGMHRGGHMMMELDRLKTSLRLNPSQTASWDRARDMMKPPTDMREKMKARRERVAAMLDDPAFDPRKLAADMESAQAERRAKMTSIRDAWFAVYDSLNPVQRGQAREFLRSHMAMHRRMGGEHEGWMRKRDGEPGKPPMAH